MIEVIDDFLSKDEFETLKGYVFHPHFPLYLQDEIVDDEKKSIKHINFSHTLY